MTYNIKNSVLASIFRRTTIILRRVMVGILILEILLCVIFITQILVMY